MGGWGSIYWQEDASQGRGDLGSMLHGSVPAYRSSQSTKHGGTTEVSKLHIFKLLSSLVVLPSLFSSPVAYIAHYCNEGCFKMLVMAGGMWWW